MSDSYLNYVIALSSSKGGVGKTTLTNVLANALCALGYKVTIIDADPNLPQMAWQARSRKQGKMPDNISVVKIEADDTIFKTIKECKATSDVTLIDLEGRGSMIASDAMSRSDLVIIPAQPSVLDSREAVKGLKLIKEAEERFDMKIPHVVTFTKTSPLVPDEGYWELREQFESQDVPILCVELHERVQYRDIFLYGGSLHQMMEEATQMSVDAQANLDAVQLDISDIAKLPTKDRSEEQKERLKLLQHNKSVYREKLMKSKTKAKGYGRAVDDAKKMVTAVINFISGKTKEAVYEKGLRRQGKELVDL